MGVEHRWSSRKDISLKVNLYYPPIGMINVRTRNIIEAEYKTELNYQRSLLASGNTTDSPGKIKSLKKRMKEKRFAAGVDRDAIRLCEQLGLELPEFLEIDMAGAEIEQIVHLSDIKLPEGVELP